MVTKQTVNTCHRNSKHPRYHVTVVNEVNTLRITSSKWLKQHPTLQNLGLLKREKTSLSCNRILQKIDTLSRYNNGMRDETTVQQRYNNSMRDETYIFDDRL